MRLAAFLMLMLCLVTADAREAYRWIAPDGSVYYSEVPQPGAERIVLPDWPPPKPRQVMPPPPPRETIGRAGPPVRYESLDILEPKPGATIRDNEGNVAIGLALEPELNTTRGHLIQVLLNGQPRGDPSSSLEPTLQGVERGKHTVAVQVIDKQGKVLVKSQELTFYLQRQSPLLHPPRDTSWKGVPQAPRAPMAPRAPRAPHALVRPAPPPPPAGGAPTIRGLPTIPGRPSIPGMPTIQPPPPIAPAP